MDSDRTSSVITGGITLSAAGIVPLIQWGFDGFSKPVPPGVVLILAAIAFPIGHAIYNLTMNLIEGHQSPQPSVNQETTK